MQSQVSKKSIYFGKIPKFDSLIALTLLINSKEKQDKSVKTDFHWQILKCRILIFSAENIMASPALNSLKTIHLISSKDYYKNGHLIKLLDKNNLKIFKEYDVTSNVFESCFKYTLLAKLAPKWNQVRNIFVEGRDFLMAQGLLNGIQYDLKTDGNELIISIAPITIRLDQFHIDDYEETINKNENETNIEHDHIWVHVLPSMKCGRIVYISKKFPKQSSFNNYKEIRRHWKNIYGYRLPENDNEIIYVGIHFFGSTIFTYPIQCLRTNLSIVPGHNHNFNTVYKFIAHIGKLLPTICGFKFQIKNEIGFSVTNFLKAKNALDTDRPNWIPDKVINNFHRNEIADRFDDSAIHTQDVSLCTPSQVNNDKETETLDKTKLIKQTFFKKSIRKQNFSQPFMVPKTLEK